MISNYDVEARRRSKMKDDDRILILRPMPGKTARDINGRVDPRLFNGDNKLHIIYNNTTGMWGMRYDVGIPPEPLRQKFTMFGDAVETARLYFAKRDVEIERIDD
jgi:hypothetical protein